MANIRVELTVRGRVQGVGFRYFARDNARDCGVLGWVRNCWDGSVEAAAQGESDAVERFVERLTKGPRLGHVESIHRVNMPEVPAETGFVILH